MRKVGTIIGELAFTKIQTAIIGCISEPTIDVPESEGRYDVYEVVDK